LAILAQWEDPADAAAKRLTQAQADLPESVARRAMEAVFCAQADGLTVDKLLVVDMDAPASQRRLWAFDLRDTETPTLVLHDFVAHGAGSDRNADGKAEKFSNRPNSHMTSLGLYKIAERYHGKSGWSRRLDGLFDRFNGKARERAVVMHPATYVRSGRVGRSQGCPAVSQEAMTRLEKAGLKNAVLWIDALDQELAQAVAECSQERRGALLAQALQLALQSSSSDKQPWALLAPALANVDSTRANPEWPHWPEALACRLTVPSSRRWTESVGGVDFSPAEPSVVT
jgi:hypothetical protein